MGEDEEGSSSKGVGCVGGFEDGGAIVLGARYLSYIKQIAISIISSLMRLEYFS